MRYLYTALFYLALPFIFGRLLWRSRRQPDYRQRLSERFGYYPFQLKNCIWVHAVSVGEVIAAIPLISGLKSRYPDSPLLVTTMTPTGAARVQAAFGDTVKHVYIPYDLPAGMRRFLKAMQPRICIIMETELWPNLLAETHQQAIPICLVNARLSAKSAQGYQRIPSLARTMLKQISVIAAQGAADAKRLIALGAPSERVSVTGNLKFDIELPATLAAKSAELHAQLGSERFIWVAASTHEGEETQLLAAHKLLREKNPTALLILVPRHPHRFDAIADLCQASFVTTRRSSQQACTAETAVYLGDSMGELLLLYSVADAAFVGGSFIERGGHNMLEPAALGKPILTGPSVFNFADISQLLLDAKAMVKVDDAQALAAQLIVWMQDAEKREQVGQFALQVIESNRGTLARQLELISRFVR